MSQRRLAVKSDAGEKEVCADSDLEEALKSEYEWESSCSEDMAILLPEAVTAIGEEQAAETETVAVGTLTKGKRNNATRKSGLNYTLFPPSMVTPANIQIGGSIGFRT